MNDATLRFIVFLSLASAVISQEEEFDVTLSHCESFGDGDFHLITATVNASKALALCSSPLSKVDFTLTPPGGQTKVLCSQIASSCNLTFNARKCRCADAKTDGTMMFELMYKHPKGGSLNASGSVGTGPGTLTVVTNCASMTISSCGNETNAIAPFVGQGLSVVIFTVVVGVLLGVFAAIVVGINSYCQRRKAQGPGAPPTAQGSRQSLTGPPQPEASSAASVGGPPEVSVASTTEQSSTKAPSPQGSEFSDASSAQLGSEVDDDTSTVA